MAQKKRKQMGEVDFCAAIKNLVRDCEAYRNERSQDRIDAMEYYDGDMSRHVPSEEGRSSVVSRDVRSAINKVFPSVSRTILGGEKVGEYLPKAEGDEAGSEQSTEYINYVVLPECRGKEAIEDAIHDAMRLRNGIIKWYWEDRQETEASEHSGLSDLEFAELVSADEVEVLEHSEYEQDVEGQVLTLHDARIRRTVPAGRAVLQVVQPEDFLIHSEALSFDDAPIIGDQSKQRRSDLVSMGYTRAIIDNLPMADGKDVEVEDEKQTRERDVDQDDPLTHAMQEVDYYELYARIDYDGDGIAELRRVVFAGGLGPDNLLENEEWDEVVYADIKIERRPHHWEGNSIADEVMELQKIKTVLLRQTLDNLYWQNNPQPVVQEGVIQTPEAVLNPKFGQPIRTKNGIPVKEAIQWNIVPMVADKSYAMLEYLDGELTDRTGISDASSGMAPDALQNMTAKASSMVEAAGIGQTERMVRTIAECLKPVFKGLLRLIIKHQDKPRTIRLRDQWVSYDPKQWNAGMDVTINTGLGAGSRERDLSVMSMITGLQEKLLSSMGADNPFVKPGNLYNALAKTTEATGVKDVDLFFTKPDPDEVAKKLAAAGKKQDPAMEKVKLDAQAKQAEMQISSQTDAQKLQMEHSMALERMKQEFSLKRDQIAAEIDLKREQLAAELQMKREAAEAERAMKMALGQQAASQPFNTSGVHIGGEPG